MMRILRSAPKGLDSARASSKVAKDVLSEALLEGGCTALVLKNCLTPLRIILHPLQANWVFTLSFEAN